MGQRQPVDSVDPWDPLHSWSIPGLHWSRSNLGEAMPGVLTPLSWTLWADVCEHAPHEVGYAVGALTRRERQVPAAMEDRVFRIFYGRPAMQLEYLATLGDRMPGTTGELAIAGLGGRVPDDVVYRPTMRRYPFIAARLPIVFLTNPRRVRIGARATSVWYHRQIARIPRLDQAGAVASFVAGQNTFDRMLLLQTAAVFSSVQPLYDALGYLTEKVGRGDVATLSGHGGAEMEVVGDIWSASRGRMPLRSVRDKHGFHGPSEGELSSRVWREDDTPLRRLIEEYKSRNESDDPAVRATALRAKHREMVREVVAAVPRSQRAATRLLLRLAADRIPLRGVAKRSFLQGIDVARASARRIGVLLAEQGRLDDPEHVFYLTAEEITGRFPDDAAELIARRRERRAEYEKVELPSDWTGMPAPITLSGAEDTAVDGVLSGIGVSPGVVEGRARVVTDPSFAEVEPGEILVAPTTDPGWAPIMFISSGLVVDIGGALSHAAVVARELGIPCVVNTGTGSRNLRTGDLIRVDGRAGTVEVLRRTAGDRAPAQEAS